MLASMRTLAPGPPDCHKSGVKNPLYGFANPEKPGMRIFTIRPKQHQECRHHRCPASSPITGEPPPGQAADAFTMFLRKMRDFLWRNRAGGRDGGILERHFPKEFLPGVPKMRTKALGTPKKLDRSSTLPLGDRVFPPGHPRLPSRTISLSPPSQPKGFYKAPALCRTDLASR